MIVFFVGPSSGRVTGQSVAFNLIYKNYEGKKFLIDYPDFTGGKLKIATHYIMAMFNFFIRNLRYYFTPKVVYITTSRTITGFIRDLFFILVGKFFNAKVVNHLHGSDFRYFRDNQTKCFKAVIDFVYDKISVSIVLTESMKEQYSIYTKMQQAVVANCYSGLSSFDEKNVLDKTEIRLVYLSNLIYSKGVLHLVKAVKEAHKSGVNVSLKLAGAFYSDEYYSDVALEQLITNELDSCDYIKFVGTVCGEKKNELLLNSDVFVLPTFYRSEAQPISIIEAMYYGCVIVTTDHNYLSDFISGDNGFIIEKSKQHAIYEAIISIDKNRDYYKMISERNMKIATENFSSEIYIRKISEIINEA